MADGGPAAHDDQSPKLPHADFDHPNYARIRDFFLGGSLNTPIDRMEADRILHANPHAADRTRALRAFLGRAVEHMLEHGIRQFLDLGSGLPTCGATHLVAHRRSPEARVVYIDPDPATVTHGRLLLQDHPNATILRGDTYYPAGLLERLATNNLIDFSQPLGLLAIDTLQPATDDDDLTAVVDGYSCALPPASHLALTYPALTYHPGSGVPVLAPSTDITKTVATIASCLRPMQLVFPGIAPISKWIKLDLAGGADQDLGVIASR